MRLVITSHIRSTLLVVVVLVLHIHSAHAEGATAPGPFTDSECITCHTERDAGLVEQWRNGPHANIAEAGCISCHGKLHKNSKAEARKNQSCIGCHQGPASHSYATSKHGAINRINQDKQDWQKPLQRGNYRSPGCSYCHLHAGNHGNTMMASNRSPGVRQLVCSGCHSPRYIRELFANGERQLEIADLKLLEGEKLLSSTTDIPTHTVSSLRNILNKHRQNVLYGVGHQSPDYQWWHGQPALDGDLINIRDAVMQSQHRNTVEPPSN